MSILNINLGNYANDGTGDDLRTAFEKVNANFAEINLTSVLTAENLGSGSPLFSGKDGTTLQFRSLQGGQNIEISYTDNEITISTLNLLSEISQDTSPELGGNLNLNNFNIVGSGDITVNGTVTADNLEGNLLGNVIGNITGTVSDISNHDIADLGDVSEIAPATGQALVWNGSVWRPETVVTSNIGDLFDFGIIGAGAADPLQLVLQFTNIDFDTVDYPSNNRLDLGPITPDAITYSLSRTSEAVDEGSSITLILQTTNLPDGTLVPYAITGVTSSDLSGAPLTGSFIINNNQSTLTLVVALDADIEGAETAVLTLTSIVPEVSISFVIVDSAGDIDGGTPSTTTFIIEVDGGTPSTTFFDSIIDGGDPGVSENIDGGTPSTEGTVIIDGGDPSTASFSEELDGGIII
jgi:hypothetical protein